MDLWGLGDALEKAGCFFGALALFVAILFVAILLGGL